MRYRECKHGPDALVRSFRTRIARLLNRMRRRGFTPCMRSGFRTRKEAARNARKGTGIADSMHCYGVAADIICGERGWRHPEFFQALGEEAEALGLVWGGDWRRRDYPHVQAIPVSAQNRIRNTPPHRINLVAAEYLCRGGGHE